MKSYRRVSFFSVLPFVVGILVMCCGAVRGTGPGVLAYSSFGPGNAYNSGADWIIGGTNSTHGYQGHAEYFMPGISGDLYQIQLATKLLAGGGVPKSNLFIAQDNGSGIPGSILESFPNVTDINGILSINSVMTPLLQAGQKYWLCDEPVDTTTYTGWCFNNQGIVNNFASESSEWGWYPFSPYNGSSVFSISVTPVPEPTVMGLGLLGAGLAALVQHRRRNRR
jgi:MYXO-CTERM domain-containing protein